MQVQVPLVVLTCNGVRIAADKQGAFRDTTGTGTSTSSSTSACADGHGRMACSLVRVRVVSVHRGLCRRIVRSISGCYWTFLRSGSN